MCTAVSHTTKDHYFGRNLDLEYSYHEAVTITPRGFPFEFRAAPRLATHHAIIGMATVADGYPLYYDATNEKGLSVAGLNFPENADYKPAAEGKTNIAPFEFIPWILGQFETIDEVKRELQTLNLVNIDFSETFPLSPLHWIIADRNAAITVESVEDGLRVYDNAVGVLTNNPTFDIQSFTLNNYMQLSAKPPQQHFSAAIDFDVYSRGMGGIGLPGDLSSSSRFAKAAFTKLNSVSGIRSRNRSASSSRSSAPWRSSADASRWRPAATRSRSTRRAATPTRASTTTRPTRTAR